MRQDLIRIINDTIKLYDEREIKTRERWSVLQNDPDLKDIIDDLTSIFMRHIKKIHQERELISILNYDMSEHTFFSIINAINSISNKRLDDIVLAYKTREDKND